MSSSYNEVQLFATTWVQITDAAFLQTVWKEVEMVRKTVPTSDDYIYKRQKLTNSSNQQISSLSKRDQILLKREQKETIYTVPQSFHPLPTYAESKEDVLKKWSTYTFVAALLIPTSRRFYMMCIHYKFNSLTNSITVFIDQNNMNLCFTCPNISFPCSFYKGKTFVDVELYEQDKQTLALQINDVYYLKGVDISKWNYIKRLESFQVCLFQIPLLTTQAWNDKTNVYIFIRNIKEIGAIEAKENTSQVFGYDFIPVGVPILSGHHPIAWIWKPQSLLTVCLQVKKLKVDFTTVSNSHSDIFNYWKSNQNEVFLAYIEGKQSHSVGFVKPPFIKEELTLSLLYDCIWNDGLKYWTIIQPSTLRNSAHTEQEMKQIRSAQDANLAFEDVFCFLKLKNRDLSIKLPTGGPIRKNRDLLKQIRLKLISASAHES